MRDREESIHTIAVLELTSALPVQKVPIRNRQTDIAACSFQVRHPDSSQPPLLMQ